MTPVTSGPPPETARDRRDITTEPTRDEVDRTPGRVVLEFGAGWCPHCQAIRSDMMALLGAHPAVRHVTVEDGRGKPLGRSFRVKLWPTLVFLKDGRVVGQLVRPSGDEIASGFADLAAG